MKGRLLPLLLIGGGGHARVLIDAARKAGFTLAGLVDSNPAALGGEIMGIPVLGDDSVLDRLDPVEMELALGIGSTGDPSARRRIFEALTDRGFRFPAILHPSAILAEGITFGASTQIMAGAVLQPGVLVGDNVIVNTGAVVDHEVILEDHVHVAPGAMLCGNVRVGEASHVGAGATVIQGVRIGRGCQVAAGAVVVDDIGDGFRVAGVPARRMKKETGR